MTAEFNIKMLGRVTDINAVLRHTPEQVKLAPTLSSIEVNICLAQLFHDNTPLTLELAERFANERWPENRERAYDRRGKDGR